MLRVYRIVCSEPRLPVVHRHVLRKHLREVCDNQGLLLWDYNGLYGLVPVNFLENALVPGCVCDITWNQTVRIDRDAARLLLQHAEELGQASRPQDSSTGSEGN